MRFSESCVLYSYPCNEIFYLKFIMSKSFQSVLDRLKDEVQESSFIIGLMTET